MFGLIPRTAKKTPVPTGAKIADGDTPSGFDEQTSSEELRLAHALEKILTQKQAHHSGTPTQTPKPTHSVGLMDRDGPGFFWVTSTADNTETTVTSNVTKRWLQRAERQSRWARVRRMAQRIVFVGAIGAVVFLALWPNLT